MVAREGILSGAEREKVFVAYPSAPAAVGQTISAGIEKGNSYCKRYDFQSWEQNDIAGRPLIVPIVTAIDEAPFLVADVTRANFNVAFEIGYAIGRKKRVVLTRNVGLSKSGEIEQIGIFDTLGFLTYQDSSEFCALLTGIKDISPLPIAAPLNKKAPLYLIETPIRTEAMIRIAARVKKARLQYRSFSPSEDVRLSAPDAIRHVAASFGVVVPLLPLQYENSDIHNVRAAFIAGLAYGMDKPCVMLQEYGSPIPLDMRDDAKIYRHPQDIDDHIQALALDVMEAFQGSTDLDVPVRGALAELSLGDPMAENEFQTLGEYYLETDQFNRAIRGEVNLVVGRKGTGKTALFAQARDAIRKDKLNVVVDLKPEGYQLVKLKENVLGYLTEGAKEHLITAFWEYLLYMEICYKVLEKDQLRYKHDHELHDKYLELKEIYGGDRFGGEGDFSERLLRLSASIAQTYEEKYRGKHDFRMTEEEVTALVYSHDIRLLRKKLSEYLKYKKSIWLLFDNLDKGWTPQNLSKGDIIILRCLIDASRKIQREMNRDEHNFHAIVFVRNDVYQLLMDETPDFGKEMRASLDWGDPDMLREVLRRRLVRKAYPKDATFSDVWNRISVSHLKGEETSQYLIDRSLMRPRNLLKLLAYCRGFAVNLAHAKIEAEDIEKGVSAYSVDLVIEADRELADIEPNLRDLIYQFTGEASRMTSADLDVLLEMHGLSEDRREKVRSFLLYFGFLGIQNGNEEPSYIFDVGYDMKMLEMRARKFGQSLMYVLNPAFWSALDVKEA